jgi:pimeloyl-ACP methyl ester carboxylesterase
VLPLLPRDLRIIVPDLRGFGESEKPATAYSMTELATDVLALMDELRVPTATVMGHSMGSFVARRVAEIGRDRVEALMLEGSAATPRNEVVRSLTREVQHFTDPIDRGFVREFQLSTTLRPLPEPFLNRLIDESLKVPAYVWKAALGGLLAYEASPKPLRSPTFVLGGADDAIFTRAEQEAIATAIPAAAITILDGVGHSPHWENPEGFAAWLREIPLMHGASVRTVVSRL